jgi:hypothetical protein
VAKKDDNSELLIAAAVVVGVWWLSRQLEEGGKSLLDSLFGWGKPPTRFEPMPDWKQTEYQPTEIEIAHPSNTPSRLPKMGLAYARAFRTIFGKTIPRGVLARLLAQSAVETGNWKKGFFEWNPANITTTRPRGFYFLPDDAALPREQRHKYAPYPNAETGAAAHIATLMRVHRPAWDLILSEAPAEDIASALKESRFFESAAGPYGQAMAGKLEEILRKLPAQPEPTLPPA